MTKEEQEKEQEEVTVLAMKLTEYAAEIFKGQPCDRMTLATMCFVRGYVEGVVLNKKAPAPAAIRVGMCAALGELIVTVLSANPEAEEKSDGE